MIIFHKILTHFFVDEYFLIEVSQAIIVLKWPSEDLAADITAINKIP